MNTLTMSERTKNIIILLIVLLFLIACFCFLKTGHYEEVRNGYLVASVAETKIFAKDLENKTATESCYQNENFNNELALIALVNTALEKEVLKNSFSSNVPSDNLIKERKDWVDENTKNAEILNCVKNVYGNDENSYLNWYIAPTLENPALYNSFYNDKEINKEEIAKIQEIKEEVDNGKKISEIDGYKVLTISKEVNPGPSAPEDYEQVSARSSLIENILKKLKPGEIWPEIVEEQSFYALYQLIEENAKEYKIGTVVVIKKDFDAWFKDFVQNNIEIKVFDQELLNKIKQDYNAVFWINDLTFN